MCICLCSCHVCVGTMQSPEEGDILPGARCQAVSSGLPGMGAGNQTQIY